MNRLDAEWAQAFLTCLGGDPSSFGRIPRNFLLEHSFPPFWISATNLVRKTGALADLNPGMNYFAAFPCCSFALCSLLWLQRWFSFPVATFWRIRGGRDSNLFRFSLMYFEDQRDVIEPCRWHRC